MGNPSLDQYLLLTFVLALLLPRKIEVKDGNNPLLRDVSPFDEIAHSFSLEQVHSILTKAWKNHQSFIQSQHELPDNCTLPQFLEQTTLVAPEKLEKLYDPAANGFPFALRICNKYLFLRIKLCWNDRLLQTPFTNLWPRVQWEGMQKEYPDLHLNGNDSANGIFCRIFAELTRPPKPQDGDRGSKLESSKQSGYHQGPSGTEAEKFHHPSKSEDLNKLKGEQLISMLEGLQDPFLDITKRPRFSSHPSSRHNSSSTTSPLTTRSFHSLVPRVSNIASQPLQRRFATSGHGIVDFRRPSPRRACSAPFNFPPMVLRTACSASVSIAFGHCLSGNHRIWGTTAAVIMGRPMATLPHMVTPVRRG